jgi:predicted DNA-binding transcriptional regulator AlpA
MPRIRLTKSAIDAMRTSPSDVVYWDSGCPGFGVKVTPKGRKVFVVLYRTGGAGSKLRKYTIGPYGRVTLHQARVAAQKVFAAKLEGRDPAAEKRERKRRVVADRVEDQASESTGIRSETLLPCSREPSAAVSAGAPMPRNEEAEMLGSRSGRAERLLTPRDAATVLRLSPSWLAKARMRGDGPPYVKLGRSIRYREEGLFQWLKSRARLSTSER